MSSNSYKTQPYEVFQGNPLAWELSHLVKQWLSWKSSLVTELTTLMVWRPGQYSSKAHITLGHVTLVVTGSVRIQMQDCLTLKRGHPLSIKLQKVQIPVFPGVCHMALDILKSSVYRSQDSFACNVQTSAQTYLSKSEHFTGLPGLSHEIQGQEVPLQKNENRKWNIIRKQDSYSPYSARLAALLVSSSVVSLWTLGFLTFSHAWSKIVTALLDSSAATEPPSFPASCNLCQVAIFVMCEGPSLLEPVFIVGHDE